MSPRRLAVSVIRLYQRAISPLLPDSCRFYPTCSQYTISAVQNYGVLKGAFMGIWRIVRCNPFSRGGFDPLR